MKPEPKTTAHNDAQRQNRTDIVRVASEGERLGWAAVAARVASGAI